MTDQKTKHLTSNTSRESPTEAESTSPQDHSPLFELSHSKSLIQVERCNRGYTLSLNMTSVDAAKTSLAHYFISEADYRKSVSAFGLPKSMLEFSLDADSTLTNLAAKKNSTSKQFGFVFMVRSDQLMLRVNYSSLHSTSVNTFKNLIPKHIEQLNHTEHERLPLKEIAAFVRGLKYINNPPKERILSNSKRVVTAGFSLPIQTLIKGEGDCDSLSLLFSSLTEAILELPSILLLGDVEGVQHAFIGIKMQPIRGDLYLRHKGEPYVVFDLTVPVSGPTDSMKDMIRGGEFEVIQLSTE
jgi:hypothetical protein